MPQQKCKCDKPRLKFKMYEFGRPGRIEAIVYKAICLTCGLFKAWYNRQSVKILKEVGYAN